MHMLCGHRLRVCSVACAMIRARLRSVAEGIHRTIRRAWCTVLNVLAARMGEHAERAAAERRQRADQTNAPRSTHTLTYRIVVRATHCPNMP